MDERFEGEICGFGTASGHRIVVGSWPRSPFGPFADVMHEQPDGTRILRAPTDEIATFVQETYRFDRVAVLPVSVDRSAGRLALAAGDLTAEVAIGRRSALGQLLRVVPPRLATAPAWCGAIDPIARVAMRGVRTKGTAGNDRREWYGATDQHRLDAVVATLDGADLGALADVWPPVRFGFSSTPRTPSIVAVTTTIRRALPAGSPRRRAPSAPNQPVFPNRRPGAGTTMTIAQGTRLTCTNPDCSCQLLVQVPCPHGDEYRCGCGHPFTTADPEPPTVTPGA